MLERLVDLNTSRLCIKKGFINYKYLLFGLVKINKRPTVQSLKHWLGELHQIHITIEPKTLNEKYCGKFMEWNVYIFKNGNILTSFVNIGYSNSIDMALQESLKTIS